jgi:chromosome segregation ATPase
VSAHIRTSLRSNPANACLALVIAERKVASPPAHSADLQREIADIQRTGDAGQHRVRVLRAHINNAAELLQRFESQQDDLEYQVLSLERDIRELPLLAEFHWLP